MIFKKYNSFNTPPIWLMRQAGRYLPEYIEIRKKCSNFLDLCYNVDKATEVTLQPIKRYGFDAAIIFSDILLLLDALGWDVKFEENIGPILRKFESRNDFKFLNKNPSEKLEIVYEIISKVKTSLPKGTPLIGFVGSPWTVTSYMLEGKGKQNFEISKKFIYENSSLAKELINLVTEQTIIHLIGQVKAGVDILQLFDSHAGLLSGKEYEEFVILPTKKIISKIKEEFPHIPIIGFPKGSGLLYDKYINSTNIDIIGVDQFVPISIMKSWSKKITVQGNLDPVILLTNKSTIASKAEELLLNINKENFIFNLGHGILPNTPVENVEFLVNYVREFKY